LPEPTTSKPTATAAPVDPAVQVLRRFRVVFATVRKHFRAVEKKAGISGAQAWALRVVEERPGIGVNELARAMQLHQSTASNLLRALVEAGLVAAERAGTDRRVAELRITPRGQKALAKAPAPVTGLLPEALGRLDARTLARLDRDLAKLIRELGADPLGADVVIGIDEASARRRA
jgi:DNA-binding MarR family transcriptional regulator